VLDMAAGVLEQGAALGNEVRRFLDDVRAA
jgi:hypothetical protein